MIKRPVADEVDAHFFPREGAIHAEDKHYLLSSQGQRSDIPLARSAGNFNGVDNTIIFSSPLASITNSYSFWFFAAVDTLHVVAKNGVDSFIEITPSTDLISITSNFGTTNITSNLNQQSINFNEWQHICITTASGNITVYTNGIQAGAAAPVPGATYTFDTIGDSAFKIYNFVYHDRAIITQEVLDLVSFIRTEDEIGIYSLEEKVGNVAYDSSISANHGTINGDLTNFWYEGADVPHSFSNKIGHSALPYFNGVTSQVKIPSSTDFDFGDGVTNTPFTIYVKVRKLKVGNGFDFIQRGTLEGQNRGWRFGYSTSLGFQYWNGSMYIHLFGSSVSGLPENRDLYFFVTSDGSQTSSSGLFIASYEDGVIINSEQGTNTTVTGPMDVKTSDLFLGSAVNAVDSIVYEAGIVQRVLNTAEIELIANGNVASVSNVTSVWYPKVGESIIPDTVGSHDGIATDVTPLVVPAKFAIPKGLTFDATFLGELTDYTSVAIQDFELEFTIKPTQFPNKWVVTNGTYTSNGWSIFMVGGGAIRLHYVSNVITFYTFDETGNETVNFRLVHRADDSTDIYADGIKIIDNGSYAISYDLADNFVLAALSNAGGSYQGDMTVFKLSAIDGSDNITETLIDIDFVTSSGTTFVNKGTVGDLNVPIGTIPTEKVDAPITTPTLDADRNTLTNPGAVRHRAKINDVNVGVFDGVGYIDLNGNIPITLQDLEVVINGDFSTDLSTNYILQINRGTNQDSTQGILVFEFGGDLYVGLGRNVRYQIVNFDLTNTRTIRLVKSASTLKVYNDDLLVLDAVDAVDAINWDTGVFSSIGAIYNSSSFLPNGTKKIWDVQIKNLSGKFIHQWYINEGSGSTVNNIIGDNNGIWTGHTDPNQWGKSDDAIDYRMIPEFTIDRNVARFDGISYLYFPKDIVNVIMKSDWEMSLKFIPDDITPASNQCPFAVRGNSVSTRLVFVIEPDGRIDVDFRINGSSDLTFKTANIIEGVNTIECYAKDVGADIEFGVSLNGADYILRTLVGKQVIQSAHGAGFTPIGAYNSNQGDVTLYVWQFQGFIYDFYVSNSGVPALNAPLSDKVGLTAVDSIGGLNGTWQHESDPNQWASIDKVIRTKNRLLNTGSKIDFNPYLALNEAVPTDYVFEGLIPADAYMYINQTFIESPTYSIEADTAIANMEIGESYERQAVAQFVEELKDQGNYALIDDLFLMSLRHDASLKSMKGSITPVNNGAVYVEGVGYQFAGAEWIDSGFNASTHGGVYVLNDAFIAVHALNLDLVIATQSLMGARNTQWTSKINVLSAGAYQAQLDRGSGATFSTVFSGDEVIAISNLNNSEIFVNGVSSAESAGTSGGIVEYNHFIGAMNDKNIGPIDFTTGIIKAYVVGATNGFNHGAFATSLILVQAKIELGNFLKDFLIYNKKLTTADDIRRLYAYINEPIGVFTDLEDYEAVALDNLIRNERSV